MYTDLKITTVSLGEFRMGVEGFGASIIMNGAPINFLANEILFARPSGASTKNWHEEFLELSRDTRYLMIHGAFAIIVLSTEDGRISIFKDTIRSSDGVWCEETPIWGDETCHVQGTRRHYYLQFPFLRESDFIIQRSKYHDLRLRQIMEAKKLKI